MWNLQNLSLQKDCTEVLSVEQVALVVQDDDVSPDELLRNLTRSCQDEVKTDSDQY